MENETKLKLQNALIAVQQRIELKTITAQQNLNSFILDIEHIINPEASEGRKND
ncbi:MAG TPA: hypothetical protein VMZ91_13640 [Candidatus Paceibacterota bacterium]|nr:hypothetical protein [Candidatus Paceibacterota bacterium]